MRLPSRRPRDPKVEDLRSLPIFAGASERELVTVASIADDITVPAGMRLCEVDRASTEAYLILDGFVEVLVSGVPVATLGRGKIVGELGVIDGGPRSADVVAVGSVTALAIPARAVRGLLESSHAFRQAVLRQLAGRVRELDDQVSAIEPLSDPRSGASRPRWSTSGRSSSRKRHVR